MPDGAWWYVPGASPEEEWRPSGYYACPGEPAAAFMARMRLLRSFLAQRPEQTICVLCHWAVIRALTGLSVPNCEVKVCRMEQLLQEPFVDP